MLGRVVSKLITDVSDAILIAPMWKRDQQWWQDIQPYVKRRCYFKTGHHLFEVEGKSQPLNWPVEAYWVDVMGYWFEHQKASRAHFSRYRVEQSARSAALVGTILLLAAALGVVAQLKNAMNTIGMCQS